MRNLLKTSRSSRPDVGFGLTQAQVEYYCILDSGWIHLGECLAKMITTIQVLSVLKLPIACLRASCSCFTLLSELLGEILLKQDHPKATARDG